MYQMTPNKTLAEKAVLAIRRTTGHPTITVKDVQFLLHQDDCPMSIWIPINNLTCNLYRQAGNLFDKAGDPENILRFDLFHDDAVDWIVTFYNQKGE